MIFFKLQTMDTKELPMLETFTIRGSITFPNFVIYTKGKVATIIGWNIVLTGKMRHVENVSFL